MMQNNQAIPFNKENFKLIFSKEFALVIIISIPSAIVAEFFNIPLAWFLGPMLITSLASLMGLKTKMPKLVLSSILILFSSNVICTFLKYSVSISFLLSYININKLKKLIQKIFFRQ